MYTIFIRETTQFCSICFRIARFKIATALYKAVAILKASDFPLWQNWEKQRSTFFALKKKYKEISV